MALPSGGIHLCPILSIVCTLPTGTTLSLPRGSVHRGSYRVPSDCHIRGTGDVEGPPPVVSGSVQVPGPWHAGPLVPVPILVFMPTLAYPNSSSPSPSRHEVIEADGVGFGMQHGTKQGEWQDEDCRRSLSCTQLALHSSNRHLANRLTRWDVRALPYPAPRVGWAGPPLLHTAGWVGISF